MGTLSAKTSQWRPLQVALRARALLAITPLYAPLLLRDMTMSNTAGVLKET